jgi:hypothetical protein
MDEQIFSTELCHIQQIAGLFKDDAYETTKNTSILSPPPPRWHWQTHKNVFKTMNDQYATLDLSRQAGIDFDNLWMTNMHFQNFIAEFSRLTTKVGKTDSQKVEALKVKVSQDLAGVSTNRSDKPGLATSRVGPSCSKPYTRTCRKRPIWTNFVAIDQAPAVPVDAAEPTTSSDSTDSDAGDLMVLDVRRGPRPSRGQCAQQGLCFYCKQPGHSKDNCVEKRTRLTVLMLGPERVPVCKRHASR